MEASDQLDDLVTLPPGKDTQLPNKEDSVRFPGPVWTVWRRGKSLSAFQRSCYCMKLVHLHYNENAGTCNEERNLRLWSVLQPEIFYCPMFNMK